MELDDFSKLLMHLILLFTPLNVSSINCEYTCEFIQRVYKTTFRSHLRRTHKVLVVLILIVEHWIDI